MASFVTYLPILSASRFLPVDFANRRHSVHRRPAPCSANGVEAAQARRRARPPCMLFGLFEERKKPIALDLNVLGETHAAISVQNLRKTYIRKEKGSGRKKTITNITAVDNVSFTVPRGTIFGLLGPNSSGKTTIMRCMSTLIKPDSGSVEYYGVNAAENSLIARNMVGFVMQSAGFDKVLTGREHLHLFADLAHVDDSEKEQTIDAAIDMLGLSEFIDLQTAVYSGGVARRLDLAIALLHRPPILILDEPTVGLDIESRRVIWDMLRGWRANGGTVVLSSHYLEEVDVLCDKVAIMERGIMIANGTPSSLKDGLGGDRITVRLAEFTPADKAEQALGEIRRRGLVLDGVVNRLKNNAIELVVDPMNASIGGEIVQTLAELGFERLFSFSQSKPSLDDVYLAATGNSLMDADVLAKSSRTEKSVRQENMS